MRTEAISSTVDLLGRTIPYTDIWGNTTTTTFDQAGRVTDQNGPVGARHTDYDGAGRISQENLGGQRVSLPAYNSSTGRLESVSYPPPASGGNGTSASITYDGKGRQNGISFSGPGGGLITSDSVTLSDAGRVSSEVIDGNTAAPSTFTHDGVGRLSGANIPGHTLSYGYAASLRWSQLRRRGYWARNLQSHRQRQA